MFFEVGVVVVVVGVCGDGGYGVGIIVSGGIGVVGVGDGVDVVDGVGGFWRGVVEGLGGEVGVYLKLMWFGDVLIDLVVMLILI